MKIQNLFIAALSMTTSAFAWAGEINFHNNDSSNGSWDLPDDAYNIIAGANSSDINLSLADEKNGPVQGSLTYSIDGSNTHFTINVNGEDCDVDGEETKTYPIGTKDYTVSTKSGSKCDVTVTSRDNGLNPGLKLDLYQNIDFGPACNDEDVDLKVKATQAIPHSFEDRHMVFVLVTEYSGTCGHNEKKDLKGVHMFEINEQGDFEWSNIGRIQTESYSVNHMEVFNDGTTHYILLSDKGRSCIEQYSWDGTDGNTFRFAGVLSCSTADSPRTVEVFNKAKDDKQQLYAVITSEGHIHSGYKQYATIHEWNGNGFGEAMKDTYGHTEFVTTMGAKSALHFRGTNEYGALEDYVIFANYNNEIGYTVSLEANVFKVTAGTNAQFPLTAVPSQITTHGISGWESFNIGSRTLLLPINTKEIADKYYIQEWKDNKLMNMENGREYATVSGLKDWKHIEIEGYHYFLTARGTQDSEIWVWENTSNPGIAKQGTVASDIGNASTASWESMKVGDQMYALRVDDSKNHSTGVQVYTVTLNK